MLSKKALNSPLAFVLSVAFAITSFTASRVASRLGTSFSGSTVGVGSSLTDSALGAGASSLTGSALGASTFGASFLALTSSFARLIASALSIEEPTID